MHINKLQWFSQAITNTNNFRDYFHPITRLFYKTSASGNFTTSVIDLREENLDTFTVTLKPSRRWPGFTAGQFIEISLEINGSLLSRTFSISSPPYIHQSSGMIELTIQKQYNGKVTPHLSQYLTAQKKIGISRAKGDFTISQLNKLNNINNVKNTPTQHLLLIAAGSGITPIRSIITQLLADKNNNTNVHLMYYARNNKHLFREELEYHQDKYPLFNAHFINSSIEGRITIDHLKNTVDDFASRKIYICGPGSMIENTIDLLKKNGAKTQNIHHEYFGAPPVYDIDIKQEGHIQFHRSSITTDSTPSNTLLNIAESVGLTPQYGCRMGVCHQCTCQKKQGVVYNTLTKSYSDSGAQEIQLCISVAIGDVTLDL